MCERTHPSTSVPSVISSRRKLVGDPFGRWSVTSRPSGKISRGYRREGVLTIETALPSGPRSDEAVDEEDLRRKKKALNLVIAAMAQPSQLRVETIE
jgi:hypothetical protein